MEYNGGGSGRNASFTDLVLRHAGRVSDKHDPSKWIMGVIEVKGNWQWTLPSNADLVEAMQDPAQLEQVVQALQQV